MTKSNLDPFLPHQQLSLCSFETSDIQDLDGSATLSDVNVQRNPNDHDLKTRANEALKVAIDKSKELCWMKLQEDGTPGLVIAVSVNGKVVWQTGYGFSDLENHIIARPSTVMRIASISKSITMAAVGKLIENGKLDLDKTVRHYVPAWPEKHPDITVRQLVSHQSGIRHYKKKSDPLSDEKTKTSTEKDKKLTSQSHDSEFKEFFLNEKYESVTKALDIFKDDELLSKPGEEFHYTTHGFTLLSAVIESIVGEPFDKHMRKVFKELGLENTYLDENEPIIKYRARYYMRNKKHKLINAPNVDNSYKWAGGGFLSNVLDLTAFGNAMLFSYQYCEDVSTPPSSKPIPLNGEIKCAKSPVNVVFTTTPYSPVNQNTKSGPKPYLKPETMKLLWSPVVPMNKPDSLNSEHYYGMGWGVIPPSNEFAFCRNQRYIVSHTGGAVGASSVLLILPKEPILGQFNEQEVVKKSTEGKRIPEGVVVSIICNMNNVGLSHLALEVAKIFESVKIEQAYKVHKVYLC